MKIDEIPQDALITLEISKDDRNAVVQAEIYQFFNKGIILKPIVIDGKVLNLENSGVKIRVIYEREGEKPLIWRSVTYANYRRDNQSFVVLSDKSDGAEHNRRASFRLELDMQATLNVSEKVVVHDISGSGLSFYTPSIAAKEVGSSIAIRLKGYENMLITGKVVRLQEAEDRMLHGCTIDSNLNVIKFISEEQMRRARRYRL